MVSVNSLTLRTGYDVSEMLAQDIAKQRLANQGLVKPTLKKASEVVARLGAVQAQDYGASKWSV